MAERFPPVAVTGLGIVSPIGVGHGRFWAALCAGASGIAAVPDAQTVPRLAARVREFAPREFIRSTHLRRADALSQTIVASARMALTDAGFDDRLPDPERLGVVVGAAIGNMTESTHYLGRVFTKGPALASPMIFPNLVLNAAASYTAMEIGCLGANFTVSQGEVSGEHALMTGCDMIRAGRADVVLAGGGDQCAEMTTAAYRQFRALSSQRGGTEWCSPYDEQRNGVVLGEGAAMLVLESPEHARRRGATVYAEIVDTLSFSVAAPTYDWPARAPTAGARLRSVLERSAGIELVCGSANSSRRLDACEREVLAETLMDTAATTTVTSIKGAIGEFGAAGALTAVAMCLAVHHGAIPPLCHVHNPMPAPFRFASRTAEHRRVQHALMLSFARGGAAAALLVRRAGE